jgi:hypothetical protein
MLILCCFAGLARCTGVHKVQSPMVRGFHAMICLCNVHCHRDAQGIRASSTSSSWPTFACEQLQVHNCQPLFTSNSARTAARAFAEQHIPVVFNQRNSISAQCARTAIMQQGCSCVNAGDPLPPNSNNHRQDQHHLFLYTHALRSGQLI